MKKLLRLQDIVLLGLSGAADVFNEIKDPLGIVGNGYKQLYGWTPKRFRKTDYYQTVYHSLKTGYIERIIKNGQPYLRLTTKGRERIQRDFPLARFQGQKWDGKWRMVIFDIEEKQRKKRNWLREKLKELGFGMIQESVWVLPYDLTVDFWEFVKSLGMAKEVFVMEVNHLLAGDPKELAAKIWNLGGINSFYQELYDMLTNLDGRPKISMGIAREKYLEILRQDPCLPKELLPEDWLGEKVKKMM